MPGFYGFQSVLATWHKQLRTGKIVSGTLRLRIAGGADTFTDLTWSNLYVWPRTEMGGLIRNGASDTEGMVTLYRKGETDAPRADDQLVVNGVTFLIIRVTPRLNADESSSFAVYDCVTTN